MSTTVDDALDMLDGVKTIDEEKGKPPISKTGDEPMVFKDDEPVNPMEPKISEFNRKANTFLAVGTDLPTGLESKLSVVLDTLHGKRFTARLASDKRDPLDTFVKANYFMKEFFLPWAKFDTDVVPKLPKPTPDARPVACWLTLTTRRKSDPDIFNMIPSVVRTFIARNTHLVLGEDLKSPVKFMILYTPNGEGLGDRIDFKSAGNVKFFLEVAKIFSIPVFNIQNEDSFKKLEDFTRVL